MGNDINARYHVRRREFLSNDPGSSEFIVGVVQDTREIPDENEQGWKWGKIQLDLGDGCDRVSFDFDMCDPVERADSLRKINLLAEVIDEVREAIELEVESRGARGQVLDLCEATLC